MGSGELDQIDKIFKTLGTPTEKIWKGWKSLKHAKLVVSKKTSKSKLRDKFPRFPLEENDMYLSDLGLDLLSKMLSYDPDK
jgi:cell division cycle 2-like